MNKIIFLGTGNAGNIERQLTSLLFVTEKKNFLIDCGDGMGTVRNIIKSGNNLHTISDFFITHSHADHIIGMPHILFNRLRNDQSAKIRIFGHKQTLHVVKNICFSTFDYLRQNQKNIAFIPLKRGEMVKIAPSVIVEPNLVKASNKDKIPTYAYKINSDKRSLVFSADMIPSRAFDSLCKNADTLVHECFGLDKDKQELHTIGHSTAREAGECATRANVKQLILTHLPNETIVKSIELVKEASQYFSGPVIAADDLLSLDW